MKGSIKRAAALVITSAMVLSMTAPMHAFAEEAGTTGTTKQTATTSVKTTVSVNTSGTLSNERLTHNYTNVSTGYKFKDYNGEAVIFDISALSDASGKACLTDDAEYSNPVAKVEAGDSFELKVNVPQNGLYFIGFDYLSYDESILPIEMSMTVDGEYLFYEMRSLKFETTWA